MSFWDSITTEEKAPVATEKAPTPFFPTPTGAPISDVPTNKISLSSNPLVLGIKSIVSPFFNPPKVDIPPVKTENPSVISPASGNIFDLSNPAYNDIKTLAQIPSELLGKFLVEPTWDFLSSAKELITGTPLPKLNIPALTKDMPAFADANSFQQMYLDQIKSGVPEKDAYKNTFLKGLNDAIMLAEPIKSLSGDLARATIPETLIKPSIETISKESLSDYFSGRKTADQLGFTPEIKTQITDKMQSMSTQDKAAFLQGFDLLKAKPSVVGKIFGVSQEEADKILADVFNGPVRQASSGALPGYVRTAEAGGINIKGEPVGFGEEPPQKSFFEDIAKPQNNLEGININNETKLTPEEAHPLATQATDKYWNDVINPAIQNNKAIVIGADDIKDYFGRDYNVNNHPVYSEAAQNLYKKAVEISSAPEVKLTVGGTGSGKSDFLVPEMSKEFNGVVYDSTGFNYEGIRKQIDYAISYGKTPEVYAIVPDLQRARIYTYLREIAGDHPVTEGAFIRTHSQAIDTLKKLVDDGIPVHILDTRNAYTPEQVRALDYVKKPLDLLNSLKYNETNVKEAISKITKGNAKELLKGREGKPIEVSPENRAGAKGDGKILKDSEPLKNKETSVPVKIEKNTTQAIEKAVARAKAGEVFGPRDNFARTAQTSPIKKSISQNREILDITKSTLEDVEKRLGGNENAPIDFNENTLSDLQDKQVTLEAMKDYIDNNPIQNLSKYEAKSGIFSGELPEVIGKSAEAIKKSALYKGIKDPNVLDFMRRGDTYIQEAGYNDSEEARAAYLKYKEVKEQYKSIIRNFTKEVRDYNNFTKQDIKSLSRMADQKIITLEEIEPPKVRGGIQAPKLDLSNAKDSGWMARESLDRNVEKTFTREDAKKINEFLGDHLRKNYTREIEYTDEKLKFLDQEMKKLGIKVGTDESAFVQIYGEGKTTIDQLMKEFPKTWQNIQKAVPILNDLYKTVLDDWNPVRKKFSYPEIKPVKNFFPHFSDVSFWTKYYGVLDSGDNLPTNIAGLTENFQPGKTFNRHELHRTGDKTKYDALAGAKEYIKSVSKQIHTMDSIARASSLIKYIRRSDEVGTLIQQPLKLQRFITTLEEIKQNQLASKVGGLDRNIEKFGDRKVINSLLTLSKLIGKNIIAFNPAAVLSHGVSLSLNAARVEKVPFIKGIMTTVSSPFAKDPYYMVEGQKSDLLFYRYPKEYFKTKFETADEAGGWMIKQMDIFKTRTAVASKFYELINQGIKPEIAIKLADKFAGRIVGDYSRGQKPIILNQKMFKVLAQFQFGMNDGISVLLHDIPYENKKMIEGPNGEKVIEMQKNKDGSWSQKEKNDYKKSIWQVAQWMIYAYLMNELLYKPVKGSGKGLSPINLALTLAGADDTTKGQPFLARAGKTITDLTSELPFTNVFIGNSPTASVISQTIKDIVNGNLFGVAEDVGSSIVSPIGGGSQAKKTIEGAIAIKQGAVFGPSGKMNFQQDNSPLGMARTLVFGKYASPEAQDYFNRVALNAQKEAPMQKIYDQVQTLIKDGKQTDAQKIVDGLSEEDYKIYKTVRSNALRAQTTQNEKDIYPTYQKIQDLIKQGKIQDAKDIVDKMTDEEYKAYTLIKNKGGIDTSSTPSDSSSLSLGGRIGAYFNAITTSPVQAFHDIFSGQSIKGTKNGAILVDRMSFQESDAIKKSLLPAGAKMSDYQLDHIIPLEIGGTNEKSNLKLITKAEDDANNAMENYLGKELGKKTITAKEAVQYMLDYKQGKISAEEIKSKIQ